MVDDAKSSILSAVSSTPSLLSSEIDTDSELTPPLQQTVNATQQDKIQLKMLEILERIDTKLDGSTNNGNRSKSRRVLDSYCWSHGAGNHTSKQCRFKKEGHQDNATFENRMGGSNAYCKRAGKNK